MTQINPVWPVLWVLTGIATMTAAVWVSRRPSRAALRLGRVGLGLLFVAGGAAMHVVTLATGGSYATFADPAHFSWVTDTWRSVVAPNQDLYISLLIVFEATVGVLILTGGRRTQVGLAGAIAFHLALWLFGWFETIWGLLILPAMVVLLVAERRAATAGGAAPVQDSRLVKASSG